MKKRKVRPGDNVLIVLGCAPAQSGKPSPIMVSRVKKAIDVYFKNYYELVIFSGGPNRFPLPEASIMASLSHGRIPKNKIIEEKKSVSTVQNALFCYDILKKKKIKMISVVTSDFHIARSKYIFDRIFEHRKVRLDYYPARTSSGLIERVRRFIKERRALMRLKREGIR